jgi:putative tryptophan/tyrosine transport system substrate-binding protein
MCRKMTGLALCAVLFALCFSAEAQQPAKLRKIGFLSQTGAPAAFIEAFRQGMHELGYVEGQNIVIE